MNQLRSVTSWAKRLSKGRPTIKSKWKDYDEVTWVSHNDVSNDAKKEYAQKKK